MGEPPPSSPGTSPVELRHCIDELLKFTLQSHVNGTLDLDFDLGLSVDYCSALLRDDPDDHFLAPSSSSTGVPAYPLYKCLASALEEAILDGVFHKGDRTPALFNQEDRLQWSQIQSQLILNNGAELLNILKNIKFELHVQEPYFTQLKDGLKTIEGRCAVGDYKRIASGDLILFNKCLALEVQDVHWYASFSEMLAAKSLNKVLPGVNSVKEGVDIYRKFYNEEKERSNGVLGIGVLKPIAQPYISLARIISGLTCVGVQTLLGLVRTAGTVPESLPPPGSVLISAFQLPYDPHVKASNLTDGARALAKHVNRSSNNYWGNFKGNDQNKNKVAMVAICRLISTCRWGNLHIVPPHGVVFEIRDENGYGARWSEDGAKFIGFLEPYVKDGHLKGWKH